MIARRGAWCVVAAVLLAGCGTDGGAPSTPVSQPPAPAPATVTEEPTTDVAPATLEKALVDASGCAVADEVDRSVTAVTFPLTGFGPTNVAPPHEPVDGSFACHVQPAGTLSFVAARYADATQATETASWLQGADPCHPVATVGPWMLLAAKAVGQPQRSDELEGVVARLDGRMVTTCRPG